MTDRSDADLSPEERDDWRERYKAYLQPRHPCVARFCHGPSVWLNLACDLHRDILTAETRVAVEAFVRKDHPRGGGVRTIPEGLMAVSRTNARQEWAALLRQDVEDGLWADHPDVVAAVRREASR